MKKLTITVEVVKDGTATEIRVPGEGRYALLDTILLSKVQIAVADLLAREAPELGLQ